MKIKVCCKNLKRHNSELFIDNLKVDFPKLKLKEKKCIGECSSCKNNIIAKVGKEHFLCKSDPDLLYVELKKLLTLK